MINIQKLGLTNTLIAVIHFTVKLHNHMVDGFTSKHGIIVCKLDFCLWQGILDTFMWKSLSISLAHECYSPPISLTARM